MAWTNPRTWSDGELVTASIMNTHVRDNLRTTPHLIVRKTADESVVSSTALQDDDHLFFAIGASEVWSVDVNLMALDASVGVADLKIAFTIPAGCTMFLATCVPDNANVVTYITWDTSGTGQGIGVGTSTPKFFRISGIVVNGGTAGNFRMQFAQNTSNGSAVTVKASSFIEGFLVA